MTFFVMAFLSFWALALMCLMLIYLPDRAPQPRPFDNRQYITPTFERPTAPPKVKKELRPFPIWRGPYR